MAKISDIDQLHLHLEQCKKNFEWFPAISVRAAMRALPYGLSDPKKGNWVGKFSLRLLKILVLCQEVIGSGDEKLKKEVGNASHRLEYTVAADSAPFSIRASVENAANLAAGKANTPWTDQIERGADSIEWYVDQTKDCINFAISAVDEPEMHWMALSADLDWLQGNHANVVVERELMNQKLWIEGQTEHWNLISEQANLNLLKFSLYNSVWIKWYESRLEGNVAAFQIDGDENRKEDKKIIRSLSEATDEEFWDKGHEHVAITLNGWLEKARERAAADLTQEQHAAENQDRSFIDVPEPISGATAFGLNSEGKLDPLPQYNQQHLRDLPNQRRAYVDVRSAALELQEQGQRLGPKLSPKIDRFVVAFPEQFEDAEAWPIWSAAAALRTLYWKHKAVAHTSEPDDAKLEPAIAMELRGFLDIYNVFAFGDDGLRQKDENSISPQERLKAEELAKFSQPVGQAIIDASSIRTEITLREIKENLDNVLLAVGTPYADQTFDQANKITQNLTVGLFDGARDILTDPRAVGAELAKLGIKVTASTAGGAIGYAAYNYIALVEFIAVNAVPLKTYVMTAFQSYPHLTEMIDRISLLWRRLKDKL